MDHLMKGRAQKRMESDGRILHAAAKIFGKLGYSKTTLTDIAVEAGVSQGLVSQRFGSKEKLLQEVFDQTQILSFYEEKNSRLPQAFYVLLDHLKQEVREKPEWFRFLSMIHTGQDTPQSFEERTKEMFEQTPLCSAIKEAQAQEDLPNGDPWDIFRVFFRNATNLIGWYHEFGLPMPENGYFLYAIQYNRKKKETEKLLNSQKYEIRTLETDRDILFSAVSGIYPLIVFNNLTKNTFYTLEYEHFTTKRKENAGTYDDLISEGATTIPSEIHREQFLRLFGRENVIRAYENGKRELYLRHMQTGDDGVVRWIETRMLLMGCKCGELQAIGLSRQIDDEMKRLHGYGEALQKAELASGAKSRFLRNLSHGIRTPMNSVMGYAELLQRRANDPEKVREFAEKLRVSAEQLTELLTQALDAANLSYEGSGGKVKININEAGGGIIANASELAAQRGVRLEYRVGTVRDDTIYADEIRLQRCVMSLILKAINETAPGDCVRVKLEQLEGTKEDGVRLRVTVENDGVGMSDELIRCVLDNDRQAEGITMDMAQICEDIRALGGKLDIIPGEKGNTVTCDFCFAGQA